MHTNKCLHLVSVRFPTVLAMSELPVSKCVNLWTHSASWEISRRKTFALNEEISFPAPQEEKLCTQSSTCLPLDAGNIKYAPPKSAENSVLGTKGVLENKCTAKGTSKDITWAEEKPFKKKKKRHVQNHKILPKLQLDNQQWDYWYDKSCFRPVDLDLLAQP